MTRLRAIRPLAAALLAAAVPLALGAHRAGADPADKYGWWYKPKATKDLTAVPAPPNVATEDFYVANDPSGPLAIGAVHFTVLGSGDATLTLTAADQGTFVGADIGACPAKSVWDGVFAGSWDQKPQWDAGGCQKGTPSADGKTMTWTLNSAFVPSPGEYDAVLVPQGSVPFSVVIDQPGDGALTGYTPGSMPTFDGGGAADTGAPAFDSGSAAVDASSPSLVPPGVAGSPLDLPATPDVGSTPLSNGGTGVPPGATNPGAGETALPTRPVADASGGGSGDRVLAGALLALLAGALWWVGGGAGAKPAAAGAAGGPSVGGIGRFARPRTSEPARL